MYRQRTARSAPSSCCCRGSTCSRRLCCSPYRRTSSDRTGYGPALSLRADGANLVGLRAFLSLGDFELDPLSLFEGLVTIHLDRAVVNEDVTSARSRWMVTS